MKKKKIIAAVVVIVCIGCMGLLIAGRNRAKADGPEEMIHRIEKAMGDDYKKQAMTELVATLCYGDKEGNEIKYHILKTTYYEADPSEVTGLNTNALNVLFPTDFAVCREEMVIQEWPAALYEIGNLSYLCWTYSPEVSYVLEYDPTFVSDGEIIKMAESARPVEE